MILRLAVIVNPDFTFSRNFGVVYKKGLRIMSELYKRIENLCKESGITVTSMCKKAEVSRASLSDLKMGRTQKLSADTLSKVASLFDVSVDFFLEIPPFDCWDLINSNRKGFLHYVDISPDVLSAIWGIDSVNPDTAKDRSFIVFLSTAVKSALPTSEGDWIVVLRPEYAATRKSEANLTASVPSKPDVLDEVDIAFYGEYKELSEDDKDTIRDMVRVMRERRAKKQE